MWGMLKVQCLSWGRDSPVSSGSGITLGSGWFSISDCGLVVAANSASAWVSWQTSVPSRDLGRQNPSCLVPYLSLFTVGSVPSLLLQLRPLPTLSEVPASGVLIAEGRWRGQKTNIVIKS